MSILARDYHPRRTTWIVRRISEMLEYIWRWWFGIPIEFESVGPDAGVPVGRPLRVTLIFMEDYQRIDHILTRLVLLWGRKATAYQIISWQAVGRGRSTTYDVYVQPCRRRTLRGMLTDNNKEERAAS